MNNGGLGLFGKGQRHVTAAVVLVLVLLLVDDVIVAWLHVGEKRGGNGADWRPDGMGAADSVTSVLAGGGRAVVATGTLASQRDGWTAGCRQVQVAEPELLAAAILAEQTGVGSRVTASGAGVGRMVNEAGGDDVAVVRVGGAPRQRDLARGGEDQVVLVASVASVATSDGGVLRGAGLQGDVSAGQRAAGRARGRLLGAAEAALVQAGLAVGAAFEASHAQAHGGAKQGAQDDHRATGNCQRGRHAELQEAGHRTVALVRAERVVRGDRALGNVAKLRLAVQLVASVAALVYAVAMHGQPQT